MNTNTHDALNEESGIWICSSSNRIWFVACLFDDARFDDGDLALGCSRLRAQTFDLLDEIHTFDDFTKDDLRHREGFDTGLLRSSGLRVCHRAMR